MHSGMRWLPPLLALSCALAGCARQNQLPPDFLYPDRAALAYPTGMLSAGTSTTCALHQNGWGTMYCWGSNEFGQWGNGATSTDRKVTTKGGPSKVSDAMQVACGHDHTCVVEVGGRVQCFGLNNQGQVGKPPSANVVADPFTVFEGSFEAVSSGGRFSCAVKNDGSVWCWGSNHSGELGDGTGTDSYVPVRVPKIGDAIDVVSGTAHSCALRADSSVWCWGNADASRLGPNGSPPSSTPVEVPSLRALRLAAGQAHTCAITWDGTVVCWGTGGPELGRPTPFGGGDPNFAPVTGLPKASAVAAFEGETCAVHPRYVRRSPEHPPSQGQSLADLPAVTCWGARKFFFRMKAFEIAVGGGHACAIVAGARPSCWGSNTFGQLTDGTTTDSAVPVP
jgi:alpha-tubulin suppressor-like RCC1 family protein